VKFAFIEAEKATWPVEVLCDILGVSRSGFYAWKTRPVAPRTTADAQLGVEIAATHARSRKTYGSPRVFADLKARGHRVGRKRVARLMRERGLVARRKQRLRRTTDSNHTSPVAPNVLDRPFSVDTPNTAWVTDVPYVWTLAGWLYLAVILDLCSRRVVGWAASPTHDRWLALEALRRARDSRHVAPGLVHHSDRGSPYAREDYRAALADGARIASMSRKGNCWDNAVAESFFATIKAERIEHDVYATHAAAITSIGDYIDGFYNPHRRHSSLGYLSPMEFELRLQSRPEAA
jgi:putative transposase